MELITLVRLNVAKPNKSKINNFFFSNSSVMFG